MNQVYRRYKYQYPGHDKVEIWDCTDPKCRGYTKTPDYIVVPSDSSHNDVVWMIHQYQERRSRFQGCGYHDKSE